MVVNVSDLKKMNIDAAVYA